MNDKTLNIATDQRLDLPTDPGMLGVRWADWRRLKRHLANARQQHRDLSAIFYTLVGVAIGGVIALIPVYAQFGFATVTYVVLAATVTVASVAAIVRFMDTKIVQPSVAHQLDECDECVEEIEDYLKNVDAKPAGGVLTLHQ